MALEGFNANTIACVKLGTFPESDSVTDQDLQSKHTACRRGQGYRIHGCGTGLVDLNDVGHGCPRSQIAANQTRAIRCRGV